MKMIILRLIILGCSFSSFATVHYTELKQFDSNQKYPCGLIGSVDERIQDCSYQLNSVKDDFILVTRSKDFKEIYKELSTGLLWSDRLSEKMNHSNAQKVCNSNLKEFSGIKEVSWRLPSVYEYEEADSNGIRNALPNMNYWFWSSVISRDQVDAWLFYGNFFGITKFIHYPNYVNFSVRCVGR